MLKNIKLNFEELLVLRSILNEVCNGIKILDFESCIGVKSEVVVDFMKKIKKEKQEEEVILNLTPIQLNFLINSFEEVFRQIDDWEFQTRIGITREEAKAIKQKIQT